LTSGPSERKLIRKRGLISQTLARGNRGPSYKSNFMLPRNRPSYPTALVLVLLLSPTAIAEDWTTPDGKMSVAIPDSTRFTQIDLGQEVLVGWQSNDGTLVMTVGEMANPRGERLILPPVVEGFAKEFGKSMKNSTILSSSTGHRDGLEFLTMSGKGEKDERTIYVSQVLTTTGKKVYKVLVTGNGVDTRADNDVKALFKSFKPVGKVMEPLPSPPIPTGQALDKQSQKVEETIGYRIGYVIGMLLCIGVPIAIVGLLVFLIVRLSRSQDDDYEDEDRPRGRRRKRTGKRRSSPKRYDEEDDEHGE
jgi:hypothetical protein